MKLKNPLESICFIVSLTLSVVPFFQPVSAMDKVEEQTQQGRLNVRIKLNKDIEDIDTRPLIFRELPDDINFIILLFLCDDKFAAENLSAVARTCHKNNHLSKDLRFWKALQKIYLNHLPEEYISRLIQDKDLPPLLQLKYMMRKLLSFQAKEIIRLSDVFTGKAGHSKENKIRFCYCEIGIEKFRKEFKHTILDEIYYVSQIYSLNPEKYLHVYLKRESALNRINTLIIKERLNSLKLKVGERTTRHQELRKYKWFDVNLNAAVTRLPKEGIEAINEKILSLERDVIISISLYFNELRWLPDELFLISRTKSLNLMNNLLFYIPSSIEQMKPGLKNLLIGNYPCSKKSSENAFKVTPIPLLKLAKLKSLDIRNVGLESFSDTEIFGALPKLSSLNISHNNLSVLPKSNFETGKIEIETVGNPVDVLSKEEAEYNSIKLGIVPIGVRYLAEAVHCAIQYPHISIPFIGLGAVLGWSMPSTATLWSYFFT